MLDASQRPLSTHATPLATYRLQFHKDFPFSAGRDIAGYLQELGISHVYSSPILTARAGSMHGYDVVDYDAINPEIGGEAGFREMASVLRQKGIGIILDIVPNHMAVGGVDNKLWLDLLKHGRKSAYASWFDVDFDCPDRELNGKVHAPFLGRPLGEVLAAGDIKLVAHEDGYAFSYGEHLFPIRPEDEAEIRLAGLAALNTAGKLGALASQQNYVLDWWRNAGDRINWRRFFDITQLAAVRMEEPAAFAAKHRIGLGLYAEGLIDGFRIDHVDGLGDPAGYCLDLRRHLDELQGQRPEGLREERAWLVVEKILASGEQIPESWDVDGSTGYDFMDQISLLQHDPAAEASLGAYWAVLSGRSRDFHAEEEFARHEILSHSFDGQRERLVDALEDAGADNRGSEGITRSALRRAVTSLIVQMRAYRSYATGRDDGIGAGDRFQAALDAALATPLSDAPALRFVASVMGGEGEESLRPSRIKAITRFNQLAAPLAAKAVEDTAFYRYGRLISRNDVGFDAGLMGLGTDAFHALMKERAAHGLRAMLTTATHDHKRGEDVRARLAVLSEMPDAWRAAVDAWFASNAAIRPKGLDPADEYMIYQMIVGAWPFDLRPDDDKGLTQFAQRLAAWSQKALREGKLRSGWAAPNEAYEAMASDFVMRLLTPGAAALGDIAAFVDRIAKAGAGNGLVQTALRCTLPGIPDTYQGTEYWDFSLVDPDNRRPVGYGARRIALAQRLNVDRLVESWRDGRVKQAVLRKMLGLRQQERAVFLDGDYLPIAVEGERGANVLAFARRLGKKAVIVVTARCCAEGLADGAGLAPMATWWGDTTVSLPFEIAASRVVVGGDQPLMPKAKLAELLTSLPVGVWVVDLA